MITQIRQSIFETNSSSTHVLSISRMELDPANLPKEIIIDERQGFGWEHRTYNDYESKLDYLWILANDEQKVRIKALLSILGITIIVPELNIDSWDYGYVDHDYEAYGFLKNLLEQPDLLYSFLFNDASFIETGNDHDDLLYDNYPSCDDNEGYVPNPHAIPGDYVYIKGN